MPRTSARCEGEPPARTPSRVHRGGDAVVVAILTRRHRPRPRGGDGDEVRAPLASGRRAPREFAGSRPRSRRRSSFSSSASIFSSSSFAAGAGSGAKAARNASAAALASAGFLPAADVPRSLEHDVEVGGAHDQHADAAPGPEGPDALSPTSKPPAGSMLVNLGSTSRGESRGDA